MQNRKDSNRQSFFQNLQRSLTKSKRKAHGNNRLDFIEFYQLLENNHQMADEVGPVLGLIALIYGCQLPFSYERFSLNNKIAQSENALSETTPFSLNNLNSGMIKSSSKLLLNAFEFDELMEKFIVMASELNPSFFERTLSLFDEKLRSQVFTALFENILKRQPIQSEMVQQVLQSPSGKRNEQLKSTFNPLSSKPHNADAKQNKPSFTVSKKTISKVLQNRAYKIIASLVSRNYFICGPDCEYVAGQQFDLATFLQIIRENKRFFKIAKSVIESYKGPSILRDIITYARWTKRLRTVIARIYIDELPDLVTINDMINAIQFQLLAVALQIHNLHIEVSQDYQYLLGKTLVYSIKRVGFTQQKLYLLKYYFNNLSYDIIKEFLNIDINFSLCLNPIKEATHFYQILAMIESNYSALKFKTNMKKEQVEDIISKFAHDADEQMMKTYVLDRDLEGRTTVEIVKDQALVDFFTKLEPIIDELWRSPLERKGNFMQTSTSYRILKTDINKPKPINLFHWNPMPQAHNHAFRNPVWKFSPMTRFFVDSFYILMMTLYMQFILVEIQTVVQNLEQDGFARLNSSTDQTEQHQIRQEITDKILELIVWFRYLLSAIGFLGSFLFIPIFDICAQIPLNKPFKYMKVHYILDIVATAMFLYFFISVWPVFDKYNQFEDTQDFRKEITELFNQIYLADTDTFDIILGVGIMCLWLRVVLIFRASEFLGPFIKVIGKMFSDILIFFILYMLILISFASVGTLAFFRTSAYTNLYESVITLFGSSLGGFDYTAIDTTFGDIYLSFFLICSLILLLNLLIAILSTTYSYYETRGRGLYLQEILNIWEDVQYGGHRGFMVIRTFPFHIISLIFIPFFCCCKSDRKRRAFDNFLQNLQFIPTVIVHLILVTCLSAFLLVFAYLKLVFHSALAISRYRGRQRCYRTFMFFVNFFIGIPVLAVRLIVDAIFLVYDDYQLSQSKGQNYFNGINISHERLKMIQQILSREVNHKKLFDEAMARDILIEVRSRMKIDFTYADLGRLTYELLNVPAPLQLRKQQTMQSQKLEEFKKIKEFLIQNSTKAAGNQYICYPNIMNRIIDQIIQNQHNKEEEYEKSKSILSDNKGFYGKRHSIFGARSNKVKTIENINESFSRNHNEVDYWESKSEALNNRSKINSLNEQLESIEDSVIDEGEGKVAYKQRMRELPAMAISHFVKVEIDEGKLFQSEVKGSDDVLAKLEEIILKNESRERID